MSVEEGGLSISEDSPRWDGLVGTHSMPRTCQADKGGEVFQAMPWCIPRCELMKDHGEPRKGEVLGVARALDAPGRSIS